MDKSWVLHQTLPDGILKRFSRVLDKWGFPTMGVSPYRLDGWLMFISWKIPSRNYLESIMDENWEDPHIGNHPNHHQSSKVEGCQAGREVTFTGGAGTERWGDCDGIAGNSIGIWDMEVSWVIGVPPSSLVGLVQGKSYENMDENWGYPYDLGNPHIYIYIYIFFEINHEVIGTTSSPCKSPSYEETRLFLDLQIKKIYTHPTYYMMNPQALQLAEVQFESTLHGSNIEVVCKCPIPGVTSVWGGSKTWVSQTVVFIFSENQSCFFSAGSPKYRNQG